MEVSAVALFHRHLTPTVLSWSYTDIASFLPITVKPSVSGSGLSMNEIYILLYLSQDVSPTSLKQLSDISGMSKKAASGAITRLVKKNYIRKEVAKRGSFTLTLQETAQPLLEALATAQQDFDAVRFAGFSPELLRQYLELSEKIDANVRAALRQM